MEEVELDEVGDLQTVVKRVVWDHCLKEHGQYASFFIIMACGKERSLPLRESMILLSCHLAGTISLKGVI